MKKRLNILQHFTGICTNAKTTVTGMLAVTCMVLMFAGCSGSSSSKEEKIEIDEPVKSFLKKELKANYSFYVLESHLPMTMNDLRSNGIFIASRIPDGLVPPNVINALYGGGFLSGTVLALDDKTDGMEKFDGIGLRIAIGISPDGCVNSIRQDGIKQIMLFSDDDIKRVSANDLVKVTF